MRFTIRPTDAKGCVIRPTWKSSSARAPYCQSDSSDSAPPRCGAYAPVAFPRRASARAPLGLARRKQARHHLAYLCRSLRVNAGRGRRDALARALPTNSTLVAMLCHTSAARATTSPCTAKRSTTFGYRVLAEKALPRRVRRRDPASAAASSIAGADPPTGTSFT